jgi:DNA-binding transcriptional LysR family regulator
LLEVNLTDQLIDIVDERCDLAIRISGTPRDKSTIWRKICEVPRRVITAPSQFERIDRPLTPDALDTSFCMSCSSLGQPEVWNLKRNDLRRSITAGSGVISNNGDFLYYLAKSGNCLTLLPDFIVKEGAAYGTVETFLDDWTVSPCGSRFSIRPAESCPQWLRLSQSFSRLIFESFPS